MTRLGGMTTTDGRVTRGVRNREAIIDALLACYEEGALRPSVPEVATRAGVSTRSVHNITSPTSRPCTPRSRGARSSGTHR